MGLLYLYLYLYLYCSLYMTVKHNKFVVRHLHLSDSLHVVGQPKVCTTLLVRVGTENYNSPFMNTADLGQ